MASGIRFAVEAVGEDDIERRLHDLTLDFGVVCRAALSQPLQLKELWAWRLWLWVPKAVCGTVKQAERRFAEKRLSVVWAAGELPEAAGGLLKDYEPALRCNSFLEARQALETGSLATLLPDFMPLGKTAERCLNLKVPGLETHLFHYRWGWNPRLLRLNPHARRRRDALVESLVQKFAAATAGGGGRNSARRQWGG